MFTIIPSYITATTCNSSNQNNQKYIDQSYHPAVSSRGKPNYAGNHYYKDSFINEKGPKLSHCCVYVCTNKQRSTVNSYALITRHYLLRFQSPCPKVVALVKWELNGDMFKLVSVTYLINPCCNSENILHIFPLQ